MKTDPGHQRDSTETQMGAEVSVPATGRERSDGKYVAGRDSSMVGSTRTSHGYAAAYQLHEISKTDRDEYGDICET